MDHQLLNHAIVITIVILSVAKSGFGIYCYQCVGTHPGCGTPFDWRWYWGIYCPDPDDKCVKVVERKGTTELITRDCLSLIETVRRDVPPDRYEGCRPAVYDTNLARYTHNTIKELDVKRDYYDEVTYCFCDFDERCNGSVSLTVSGFTIISTILLVLKSLWQ